MPERTLTVRIIGDDRSLQQAFKRSEKAGKGFQVGVSGIGAAAARSILPAAAAAFSVQKAFQIAAGSVDDASAVNEEIAKSEQIFGSSATEVKAWSDTMATSFGVSKRAALEATGIFGNLFSVVGIGPEESSKLSRSLVELAADMASFNNASPEDVLLALRSGLVGEAEPLRRYGVLLSEARVQQVALTTTGKSSVTQLTNQEKAYARYSIILSDTQKAQGDVARTSESLANQQRQLAANLENLSASFGAFLIPKVLETVSAVNDLIGAFKRLEAAVPGGGGGAASGFFGELFKSLPAVLDDQVDNLKRMSEDIDLILQGKGFEAKPDPVWDRLEKALTQPVIDLQNALLANLSVYDRIGVALQAGPKALQAALLKWKAQLEKDAKVADTKAFDELELGLGLKLKKTRLTEATNDDLAVLREWERAINRRIRAEGKTFALVEKLTDVRLQISALVSGQATDAATKVSDAFDDALDALDLDLDIAKSRRGFADDLRALRAIEAQILKQIAAEGRTTELLRRLFQNRQEQAATLKSQRDAEQFEALGLTAEGERRVASRGALLKRARGLREQLKGTVLDTPKTRQQLDAIVRVLKNKTKSVSREVRQAILDMLNDINDPLSSKQTGPMTKFAKRGPGDLIRGLGLTPLQEKDLRFRFAQFNRFDLAGGGGRPPGRTVRPPTAAEFADRKGERDINVNVYIDGSKVESTVTRRQEKRRGRNAPQRRGVRPGK